MKINLLVAAFFFVPAMVIAQGAPKIEAPVLVGTPSLGNPSGNGGSVAKPAATPVAVKPAPLQLKSAEAAPQESKWRTAPERIDNGCGNTRCPRPEGPTLADPSPPQKGNTVQN